MYFNMDNLYVSYGDYEVNYHNHCFEINKGALKSAPLCENLSFKVERKQTADENILSVVYDEFTVTFALNRNGIKISLPKEIDTYLKTDDDCFAMCLEESKTVNMAYGPAVSPEDNCLYSRDTDSALCINGKFDYDFNKGCYTCTLKKETLISVKRNILSDRYSIDYGKINKNCTFPVPPAGWMTWYAVKFDAGEKSVLENVEWQKKHLKDFGANTIWVDWEWYHNSLDGVRDDGVDTFNPDPEKYPHGLKYIADKIREAGFIPALWIGFTHDMSHNKYTKENPEIILTQKVSWCGQYFYDFSHPKYLEEFLPMALQQVFDWGYEAVKFDTLPISMNYHDEFHDKMYNPSLTTKEAYRNMIKKTREFLGKDMYMLSCSCPKDSDILWASDIFDAGRVGEDIFKWEEFLKEGAGRTLRFLPLHNNVLYADPDNVVLREEFNTFEQAQSRIYFVSMLGLPLNFGDNLPSLEESRIPLLKECLPVLDIRPKNLESTKFDEVLVSNLSIALPFDRYNVVSIFNTTENEVTKVLDFKELGIYDDVLVFDYNNKAFVGFASSLKADLKPCETKIYCLKKKKGGVQLLSTSRHISQGAAEIKDLVYGDNSVSVTASVIKDTPYNLYLYTDKDYAFSCDCGIAKMTDKNICTITVIPDETADKTIKITY